MTIEKFTTEYREHKRSVSVDLMKLYGKLATNDIVVPCLLAYEVGVIPDKDGNMAKIDKKSIDLLRDTTNNWIKKRHLIPFGKFISSYNKPIEEVNAIPVIKNHAADDIDGKVGYSEGLCYTDTVIDPITNEDIYCLFIKTVIVDIEAKTKVENGILRATSIGIRGTGSIKEISFVVNEAMPLSGLMMSEHNTVTKEEIKSKQVNKAHKFAEQLTELQFSERELENKIIPNHLVLSRMIKSGKLMPYRYEELINNMDTQVLEMMECSIPTRELGIVLGTNKQPEKINIDKLNYEKQLSASKKKLKIKEQSQDKVNNQTIDIINNQHNFEENRVAELKHILELAEYSPNFVAKYIKHELREEIAEVKYKDILIEEYLGKLKDVKTKIIQLQESIND